MLWTNLYRLRARTVPVPEAARPSQQAAIPDGLAGSIHPPLSGFRSGATAGGDSAITARGGPPLWPVIRPVLMGLRGRPPAARPARPV